MPNFWNFVAGASVAAIGVGFLPNLFAAIFRGFGLARERRTKALAVERDARDVGAAAFSLVCMYVGLWLGKTARFPQYWEGVSGMGWSLLFAAAVGSILLIHRVPVSKFIPAVSIIGLIAMTMVTAKMQDEVVSTHTQGPPSALNSAATSE